MQASKIRQLVFYLGELDIYAVDRFSEQACDITLTSKKYILNQPRLVRHREKIPKALFKEQLDSVLSRRK